MQNTSEFIEQIDDTYEALKEQSLDSAKEFVKDRLRDVTGLLRHAQDGLNEIAPTAGDFIRGARDSFLSSLPLPFIPVSPLVLDLDSDGYELSALDDSNVRFDLGADGFAEKTGWVQPNDALLVMDRNANGKIDNGSELFGDHTPVAGAEGTAPDGFSALSILDSNQDAILDQQDESFDSLRLWRDINQDGRSSPLELTSLADANIASIRLDATATNQIIAGHNVALESTFTDTSGTEHAIGDILFEVDPVNAEFTGDYQLSVEALMLPLIRGYGGVPHLHIAMSQDPALLSRMQTIVAQGFSGSSNLVTEVEQLIIHWTGSKNVDPDSRGQFVDARKLSVLEAFMATPFVTTQGITDPGGNHAEQINLAWEELRTGILQRLVAQDLRGSPLSGATYEFATDTLTIGGALSGFIESAKTQQPADSSDAIAYWHNISDFLRLSAATLGVTEDTVEASLETGLADTELGHFSPVLFQPHLGGSTNSDALHSGNHYNLLTAGNGNDQLVSSGTGYRALFGGAGDDELRSEPLVVPATNFVGGTGQDTLIGSRYGDTYYFNLGDGQDLIDETAGGFSSHNDRLYFGPGITREDVSVTRNDLDLIFDVGSSGDSIRVKEWYDRPGSNGSDHRIESVVFEDGIWSVDDIHTTGLEVHGTDGDDTLSTLPYQEGNILHGEGGNDTLSAGPGSNDILYGGDGDDLLIGGDVSSDYLYGGAGNDELRSHPMNAYPTHLSGGTGDDTLIGSRYGDTYYFNLGDGQDLIDETVGGFSSHNDRLYFGPGITREDVSVTRNDLDLIFDVGSSGDSIRVKEWYDRPGSNGSDHRIESVILDDRIWSSEEIEDLAVENHPPTLNNPLADVSTLALVPFEMTLDETMFSDIDQQEPLSLTVSRASSSSLPAWLTFDNELRRLSGTPSLADLQSLELVVTATDESYFSVSDSFDLTVSLPSGSVIAGTPQDDFLVGSSLDDVFVLDRGDDTLSGGDGDDSFVALGPDLSVNSIDGGSGFDTIKAGLGDDVIRVSSHEPENSIELVDGGSGFDILAGTNAAQTINLSQTTLVNIEKIDAAGGADVVIGSSGDDVIVGGSGNDILYGAGGDDQFLIRKYQGVDLFNGGEGVDSIVGGSTNEILVLREFSAANSVEIIDGGEGFDVILGTGSHQTLDFSATRLTSIEQINGRSGHDVIIGSNERDFILGGSGNDQLSGGPGDDELTGGRGNDIFSFARGDGVDIVIDDKGTNDRLILSGSDHDALWLWRQDDDLAMGIVNTTDKVVIKDWFSGTGSTIETTKTSDDSMVLINSQVLQLVGAMSVFDPIAQGHLNLSDSMLDEVAPAIAEAWQPA